ncbi:MAG: hypothetical protein ABFS34_15315 [Gemmatimonadota bacterium]
MIRARDHRALVIGAWLIGPVLAYAGAARPYVNGVAELRDAIEAEAALLGRERALVDAEAIGVAVPPRLDSILNYHAARMFVTSGPAPSGQEIASASDFARFTAAVEGVLVHDLRFEEGESLESAVAPIDVLISGETDVHGLEKTMEKLERGVKLIHVRQLSVSPRDRQDPAAGEPLDVRILLRGYRPAGRVAEDER